MNIYQIESLDFAEAIYAFGPTTKSKVYLVLSGVRTSRVESCFYRAREKSGKNSNK